MRLRGAIPQEVGKSRKPKYCAPKPVLFPFDHITSDMRKPPRKQQIRLFLNEEVLNMK